MGLLRPYKDWHSDLSLRGGRQPDKSIFSHVHTDCFAPTMIGMAICHCEEGISPTKQSFLTCQEIASPLQGSPLQDSQARNDKLRPCCARMTICHCEEGVSPTKQSFLTCQEIASPLQGSSLQDSQVRNDKQRLYKDPNRWNHLPGWDVIKISFRHDKNGNPSAALTPGSPFPPFFYGLPVLW